MKFNIALSVGFLLLGIALLVVYFPKLKIKSSRTKLFSISISMACLFLFSDIVNLLVHMYCNIDFINKFVWMLHWSLCRATVYFFSLYVLTIAYNIRTLKIKEVMTYNTLIKIEGILLILIQIVHIIFFFNDDFNINNISYIGTVEVLLSGSYVYFLGISYLVEIFRHKENSTSEERFGVIFQMFVMTTGVVFQRIFPEISTIPTTMILTAYCSYFFGDNPDILLLKEIREMKTVIDESNKVKTNFLSNMTESIISPTEVILNLSKELIALPVIDKEKIQEITTQICSSGQSLLDTVNNILDACVVEGSNTQLQERKYKVKELVDDLVATAKSKIGAKPVKLLVNVDESMSSILQGDYSKLCQLLFNILINSVENTDVGRIGITITSTKKNGTEEILFKISDTGTGMTPEEQKNVLNKTNVENGLGLGISKKYCESMGGKIWFESDYRVGTTFYVQIEQKIIDSTPIGKLMNEELTTEKTYIDCTEKKVLIIDDNELNIKVTSKYLEKYKFTIESVPSGKECLNNIKGEKEYDLILTDYAMPNMNGVELLTALKSLDGYRIPPIVILTANAITGVKEKYLKEGFDEYLSKPINLQELDRVVNKFFNK